MKRKGLLAFILCLPVCLGAVACDTTTSQGDGVQEVKVSYLDANRKITQQEDFTGGANTLSVFGSIGEYEAGQILMQPKLDIKSYDLTVNDLTSAEGKTFKKENIIVYNQKYIQCAIPSVGESLPVGWYPDALLPFEAAKEYKENTVKGGENQTIYVEFKIPYGQDAGVYTGDFQLTMDGKTVTVPVRVEVLDFEMSKDVHLKSYYNTRLFYSSPGELSGERSGSQKYFDTLIDYRLTAPSLTIEDGFDAFLAKARAASAQEREVRLSTICLAFNEVGDSFNKEQLEEQIRQLIVASFEDNINYIEKVIFRPGIFDEPFCVPSKIPKINRLLPQYYEWRAEIADKFANDSTLQGDMKEEIVAAVAKIPCLITTYVIEDCKDTIRNYCVPSTNAFNYAYERNKYMQLTQETGEIQWTYSCAGAQPGYKIDTTVLNLRVWPWMCHESGFEGTLNWENTMYTSYIGDKIDPYVDAMRSAETNGDGYLFYPGKLYGLDEPVTSVRLHALRDGYEDYEWLYLLEKLYEEKGYSSNDILSIVYPKIYKDNWGTKNVEGFSETRYMLGKLVELAKQGVFISDLKELPEKFVCTIMSENNALKSVNGKVVNADETTFECLKKQSQACVLNVETVSATKAEIMLCGKAKTFENFNDAAIVAKCKVDSGEVSAAEYDGEQTIKLTLSEARTFQMPVDTTINKNLDWLKIHLYNDLEKDVAVNIYFMGTGGQTIVQDFILKKGWNTLNITDLPNAKWHLVKKIEKLKIEFVEKVTGTVYINDVTTIEGV